MSDAAVLTPHRSSGYSLVHASRGEGPPLCACAPALRGGAAGLLRSLPTPSIPHLSFIFCGGARVLCWWASCRSGVYGPAAIPPPHPSSVAPLPALCLFAVPLSFSPSLSLCPVRLPSLSSVLCRVCAAGAAHQHAASSSSPFSLCNAAVGGRKCFLQCSSNGELYRR